MNEIYIYEITFSDDEADKLSTRKETWAACSLLDAIDSAIQLHNDTWGTNLDRNCVIDARRVSDDEPFFSKAARQWFVEVYGDQP